MVGFLILDINFLDSFNIDKEKVSLLLPSKFQEKFIRIYAKDITKLSAIKDAFKNYCKK